MIEASRRVVPILVDCTARPPSPEVAELAQAHGVRALPTVLFVDADNKLLAQLKSRSAASIADQIGEIADEHGGTPEPGSRVEINEDAGFNNNIAMGAVLLLALVACGGGVYYVQNMPSD